MPSGLAAFCFAAGLSIFAPPPAAAAEPAAVSGPVAVTPAAPQPAAAALVPGLSVLYYYQKFNSIDEIDEWRKYKTGKAGDPVLQLDAKSAGGEVFGSGVPVNVALQLDGLIHFPAAGDWGMAAVSNDGVRVMLDGKIVVLDPYVHADHLSLTTQVTVPAAGWYPLSVTYFQKGHSMALKLLWTKPGGADAEVVPAAALAHVKK